MCQKVCRRVGVYNDEGPPVPIPNTVVKLIRAENTWMETSREDRSTPTLYEKPFYLKGFFVFTESRGYYKQFVVLCESITHIVTAKG